MLRKPRQNLKELLIKSSFLYLLTFFSCNSQKFINQRVYIAPIVNKTNWVQVDTELFEYLHTFFNKFSRIKASKDDTDIQIFVTIAAVEMTTPISGRLDEPIFSEITLVGQVKLITKKTNYNFEFYETAPYIRGQQETLDYGLQRLYEKVTSRIYFYFVKVIKNDKKI